MALRFSNSYRIAYDRQNSSVFKFRRNTASDVDDCISGGKLFQTRDAAIPEARSPMVERLVARMYKLLVVADRNLCRAPMSATRSSSSAR